MRANPGTRMLLRGREAGIFAGSLLARSRRGVALLDNRLQEVPVGRGSHGSHQADERAHPFLRFGPDFASTNPQTLI